MYDTYSRIFERLGLKFRAVAADTGAIGGTGSHEFHVLADSGEDAIAFSPDSDYAANVELAEALAPSTPRAAPARSHGEGRHPRPAHDRGGQRAFSRCRRSAFSRPCWSSPATSKYYLLLLRGDHMLNEVKAAKKFLLNDGFRFASEAEVRQMHAGHAGLDRPGRRPPGADDRRPRGGRHERLRVRRQRGRLPLRRRELRSRSARARGIRRTSATSSRATPARTAAGAWGSAGASRWATSSSCAASTPRP